MSKNEETMYGEVKFSMGRPKSGEGVLWKKVGLGSMAGILLGAGALYGYDQLENNTGSVKATTTDDGLALVDNNDKEASADGKNDENVEERISTDEHLASADDPNAVIYDRAPLADVDDSMTFEEAFASARQEVGPGGVFYWHGGIYNTYYEAEWDAMSETQQAEFAQSLHPQVLPEDIPTDIIEEHPEMVIRVHVEGEDGKYVVEIYDDDNVVVHEANPEDLFADANVVGREVVDGKEVVALDTDDDGEADMMVIDADKSNSLTDDDLVLDLKSETVATVEEMMEPENFIEGDAVMDYDVINDHGAVLIDTDHDNEPDVLVIDADNSNSLSSDDIVVNYDDRTAATVGDIVDDDATDPMSDDDSLASNDDIPDVSPDMPDYVDDAPLV